MITKKDIINMARHVVDRDSGIPDRRIMHPTRDWIIGLMAALVLFVCSIVYAAYTFINHTQFAEQSQVVARSIQTYDQEKIKMILQRYEERAAAFKTLRGNVADTSMTTRIVYPEDIKTIPEDSVPILE